MKNKIRIILVIIFILNLADALFTINAISNGYTYEVNPMMNWLLEKGASAFLAVKIGVVSLILLYTYIRINQNSYKHTSKILIVIVFIMFGIVLLGFLSTILPRIII